MSETAIETTGEPKTARLKWWQTLIGVVLGLGAGMIGSSLVGGALAAYAIFGRGGTLADLGDPAALNAEMMKLPVLGTTLVVTALGFVGGAAIAPLIARLPVRRTLGLVPAHPATFLAAPVGMLALGPTSDLLVRLAKDFLPGFTLGSLEMLEAVTRAHPFLVLFPFIAIMPGVGEEIFFRGLVQRSFARPWIAIAVSAITFSLIHMDPHHVVGVLPLGFYLAWVAQRTGSTWVTILAHVANNGAALAASQLLENGDEGSLQETLVLMPIGWVVAAGAAYVIWRFSQPKPASEPVDSAATFS